MRALIFDLDGTLADTAADLLGAANTALGQAGLPLLDIVTDRQVAGRGGKSMIRASLAKAGFGPDDARADELYAPLLTAYETRIAEETRLYDGVELALETLAADGWRLGICTNKPERLALILLERLGILGRFGAVLGADSLAIRKPDPGHFTETARRIGADPAHAVMIGDTRTDLDTARAAGVPCILTSFGFAAESMEDLAPDAVIGHYDELAPALARLGHSA